MKGKGEGGGKPFSGAAALVEVGWAPLVSAHLSGDGKSFIVA